MNGKIKEVLQSLKANNFKVEFAETGEIASDKILGIIPRNAVVGVGDSASVRQINILNALERRGTKVINPFSKDVAMKVANKEINRKLRRKMLKESLECDVFLTGTNVVTLDGKIVNIDGAGNRIVGLIFGPERAIIVIGRNKIVKNIDEALQRIKKIAPIHAKTKKYDLPCTHVGKCIDCHSKARICNVIAIIERNPRYSEIIVVVIDEDLGLGWDESWSVERVNRIQKRYAAFTRTTSPFYWIC